MAEKPARDIAKEMFWRKAIERFRKSELSQADFCRRENLSANTFSWWKNEITKRDAVAEAQKQFIPLSIGAGASDNSALPEVIAEIDLDQRIVRIFNGVDSNTLRALLKALKE